METIILKFIHWGIILLPVVVIAAIIIFIAFRKNMMSKL